MLRRGNWQQGFSQRFGKYSSKIKQAITNRQVLWIHAVSVGEVAICTHLINAIETRMPNLKIVVSTTTSTGMEQLQKLLPSHIQKIYYPIDRRDYVTRAIMTIHPEVIVLVEAEIWPNFLWRAQDMKVPTFLVNARLSERSFRGYKRFGFLFRRIFNAFKGVGCQNEADAARLRALGFRSEAIHVVGNLKFDTAKIEERRVLDVDRLMRQLGIPSGARFFVAGSTHAGEEAILADIFIRLRQQFSNLYFILVPRHFERGKEVGKELGSRGIKFVYRKEMGIDTQYKAGDVDCLLVNTTGELKFFYKNADVVFVGKSLTAEGGQNPIEPAAFGKPVIFGPNMQNFEPIAKALVSGQGAIQVQNAKELEEALAGLLVDPDKAARLGRNAVRVVQENLGSIERTVDMIAEGLRDRAVFIAEKRKDPQPGSLKGVVQSEALNSPGEFTG
ncbi:MAG: 3-deoxy-D-manno-octulosonic acid transferase [Verrucomicrobiales bacterium]|nr:3-deoxy-D-manno-octulosonic acid transferase [Verrucomicrobiales bacterium]